MGAAQLVFGDFEEDEILSKTKWSKVRKKNKNFTQCLLNHSSFDPVFATSIGLKLDIYI